MRSLFTLSFFLFISYSLQAQFYQVALGNNPVVATAAKQKIDKKATARSQKGNALPFFDDFSYEGPYPSANWTDRHVFINNTLANQPISIGVATFDGLDASGSPYGGFGSADTLTSISLDLSGSASKYISYYIQPKGLGDAPGPEDRLVLEFKNTAGDWVEIQSHEVTVEESLFPLDSLPNFQFMGPYEISDAQYLHDDFQFRFRNYALRNGAVDMWHLDYVRVDASPTNQLTDDLAFTSLPSSILLEYSSAPWVHVREEITTNANTELILRSFDNNLYNHSGNTINVAASNLLINGIDNNDIVRFRNQNLLSDPASFTGGFHTESTAIRGEYTSAYRNEFKTSDNIQVKVDYSFEQGGTEPVATQQNNKVSRTFELDDYYAYDDNSAESAFIIGTGGQVAMKFTNYKADLLQAIRIHIPRIVGDISNLNFTLKVWLNDLNSDPVFEAPFTKPLFVDEFRDSLQAFTTYVLKDHTTGELSPVDLPVGEFYIGWEQVTPCGNVNCLPVGLDRNTPAATANFFVNPEGNWGHISDFYADDFPVSLTGALMIRPVVGPEPPRDSEDALSTTEIAVDQIMNIFPNPTNGILNIQLIEGKYSDFQLSVFNSLGQRVKSELLANQVDLSNQVPGIYFLQFVNQETNAKGFYKIFVR